MGTLYLYLACLPRIGTSASSSILASYILISCTCTLTVPSFVIQYLPRYFCALETKPVSFPKAAMQEKIAFIWDINIVWGVMEGAFSYVFLAALFFVPTRICTAHSRLILLEFLEWYTQNIFFFFHFWPGQEAIIQKRPPHISSITETL